MEKSTDNGENQPPMAKFSPSAVEISPFSPSAVEISPLSPSAVEISPLSPSAMEISPLSPCRRWRRFLHPGMDTTCLEKVSRLRV